MKKVILISDTHGNHRYLRQVLEQEYNYDYIFHLGDFYDDINNNPDLTDKATVVRVPGIFHKDYLSNVLSKTELIEILGWRFLLVHDVQDSVRKLKDCDVILYGHTHKPHYKIKNNKHYLNPGHLKCAHHRGYDASYIVLEIDINEIKVIHKPFIRERSNTITISKITEEE